MSSSKKIVFRTEAPPNWLDPILYQIDHFIKPGRIFLYCGPIAGKSKIQKQERKQRDLIIKHLTGHAPLKIINNLFEIKVFNPGTLVLSIVSENNLKQKDFLTWANTVYAKSPSRRSMPKCLYLILGQSGPKSTDTTLKDMLINGWSLRTTSSRMLDLTFIYVSKNSRLKPKTYNYNPFLHRISSSSLTKTEPVFPDKLSNFYGYPFHINEIMGKVLKKYSFLGVFTPYCDDFIRHYFAVALNLSVKTTILTNVDVRPEEQSVNSQNFEIMSYPVSYKTFYPLVPELEEDGACYEITTVFLFVVLLGVIVALFWVAAKLMKFNWSITSIYLGLMEDSIAVRARAGERILYLTLIVNSVLLSNELMSLATDLEMPRDVKQVKDCRELMALNLPIYVEKNYRVNNSMLCVENHRNKKYIKYVRNPKKMYECFRGVYFKKDRICVTDVENIEHASEAYQYVYGKGFEPTDLMLRTDYRGRIFKTHSLFVEKFNQVVLRFLAAGLYRANNLWEDIREMGLGGNFTVKEPYSNDDVAVLTGCIVVLGMGFSLSVFVALGEYGVFATIEWRKRLMVESVERKQKWRFLDKFVLNDGKESSGTNSEYICNVTEN